MVTLIVLAVAGISAWYWMGVQHSKYANHPDRPQWDRLAVIQRDLDTKGYYEIKEMDVV